MACSAIIALYFIGYARPNNYPAPQSLAAVVSTTGYLQELCLENLQAAGFSWMPSMKIVPLMTSASSGEPFNDRQPFDALSISLKTIARHAARLPFPLVLSCL